MRSPTTGEGFEALMEVALWLDGSYRFEELVPDVPATITKPNASILMELGRRMDEWRVISQKIPSVDLYPASTLLPGETPHGVNAREARVLALSTGYYSVAEMAEAMQKPVLTTAKDLYGLVMAGHVVLKGIRSGKPPKIEAPAAPAPMPDAGDSASPGGGGGHPASANLLRQAPWDSPRATSRCPRRSVAASPRPSPPVPAKPAPAVDDPQRMVKLMNFTQRIAQAAKMVLPEAQHEMVNRLQAKATQQIISGDGPEAVKNLALTISRGAVDAGCDADMVRTLNTHLKALFATK